MGKWKKSSQEHIDRFYDAMKSFPEVELKKMFGYPCAFLNGNLFVGLHEENLIVRLAQEEREAAIESGIGKHFAPLPGKVMREYVALAKEVISDPNELNEYIESSIRFVKTLPKKEK